MAYWPTRIRETATATRHATTVFCGRSTVAIPPDPGRVVYFFAGSGGGGAAGGRSELKVSRASFHGPCPNSIWLPTRQMPDAPSSGSPVSRGSSSSATSSRKVKSRSTAPEGPYTTIACQATRAPSAIGAHLVLATIVKPNRCWAAMNRARCGVWDNSACAAGVRHQTSAASGSPMERHISGFIVARPTPGAQPRAPIIIAAPVDAPCWAAALPPAC